MKVLLTATVQSHICQFHKPLVEVLHAHGCEVHVAAKDNLEEKNGLKLDFVDKVFDVPFARSPKSPDNIKAYKELKKIIDTEHYDIIHCNTPMGGIVTRLAARKARKNGAKVFYTAHGFHFYKGAPRKNWLVFYPIEKFFSRFTDKLITITKEDYNLAKRKFHCKAEHIHGVGVSTERFYPVRDSEKSSMRADAGLGNDDYVILCVGELNDNKNQKTLISAATQLKSRIPNLKILLAGNGPNENKLRNQITELGLEDVVRLLGYRTDLEKITPAVDLVVSCSYREGLPLNIIEGMLCKKPVVASINRGHRELVTNGINGYLVSPESSSELVKRINEIYSSDNFSLNCAENNFNKGLKYSTEKVTKELSTIYFGNE